MDILILRDPRESERKCSLTPLKGMQGIRFVNHRPGRTLAAEGRILLTPDGPELSREDAGHGLLLVDCNWHRAARLREALVGEFLPRSLPPLQTAYPRKSQVFADPEGGLASVEALYAALALLGEARPELLQGYRWRAEFLAQNPGLAGPDSVPQP
jgi:pre-rRNA-processing protein TSR3